MTYGLTYGLTSHTNITTTPLLATHNRSTIRMRNDKQRRSFLIPKKVAEFDVRKNEQLLVHMKKSAYDK